MDYREIDLITQKLDSALSAAETQGIAAGMLCGNSQSNSELWLSEISQTIDEIDPEDKIVLVRLFEDTRQTLAEDNFSFELLLPDENAQLSDQADALRQWCQGFLFGIGSVTSTSDWPNESLEALKDIAEFSKLDSDVDGEEAENDFMEISEYLRAAVMYLRTELNPG